MYGQSETGSRLGFSSLIETDNASPNLFDTGANGAILLDNMKQLGIDQALTVKTSKGIVVVIGCSYPRVGENLDVAASYGKVYGIIGGLHSFRDFSRLNGLSLVCPCHCTQYKSELKRLFPENYISCGVSLKLEL